MCFIKPLRIKKVLEKEVILENGIKAFYEKNSELKPNDLVLVYGNVVLNRIIKNSKKI